jgi:2-polyprenyl-3-methyl-5-hydroxy-6-metoxy-1,4-benzoquinol methylase
MLVERIIPDELALDDRSLTEHTERYDFAASLLRPDDIVIDAACGVGYGSAMLAEHCKHVYGYDRSPEAVAYAVSHYQSENIEFKILDLDEADLLECDVFVSFETVEHLSQPKTFLEKAKGLAGRLIVLSTPIVPTLDFNPFHLHDFDRELVEELMRPWRPAYFCVQAGDGNVLNGIWVFKKADAMDTTEDQHLLALNLRHQQSQILLQYNALKRQQAWMQELERAKVWLDDERLKWQHQTEVHVQLVHAERARVQELERDKAWLEEERAKWQQLAEAKDVN